MMHAGVAPHKKGHGKRAATDPHEARKGTDDTARREHAWGFGEPSCGFGLDPDEHLGRHVVEKNAEKAFQKTGGETGRDKGAGECPHDDSRRDRDHGPPDHGFLSVVGEETRYRCEGDAAK